MAEKNSKIKGEATQVSLLFIAILIVVITTSKTIAMLLSWLVRLLLPEIRTPQALKVPYFILTIVVFFASFHVLRKALKKRIIKRDKHYLEECLKSPFYQEPATRKASIMKTIYGNKTIPEDEARAIGDYINNNSKPIKRFLKKKDENVLVVESAWGTGKTTSVLIAIHETNNDYRYIYESVFKYRNSINEFMDDILSSLSDTLVELGVNANSTTKALADNLSSSVAQSVIGAIIELNNKELGMLTTDLIHELNNKSIKNTIVIIIDDLDRLHGKDIEKVLSLLSILRRLLFIKIIIPADIAVITESLRLAKVINPDLFIEKYLPTTKRVLLRSNKDIVEKIMLDKIFYKQNNWNPDNDGAYPTLAAVYIKLLSNRIKKSEQRLWLSTSKSLDRSSENDIIREILKIPLAMNTCIDNFAVNYCWPNKNSDIKNIQEFLTKLKRKPESRELKYISIKRAFTDEAYMELIDSWFFMYFERRWNIFNITIREMMNILNSIDYQHLPQKPGEQFVRVFNQLFEEDQIQYMGD